MRSYVTKYTLSNTGQKARIVAISDLHYHQVYQKKRFSKLFDAIKKQNPDYICIPGDLIDTVDVLEEADMTPLMDFFKNLATIAPTMLVLGNHDIEKKAQYCYPKKWVEELNQIPNLHLLEHERLTFQDLSFYGYSLSTRFYRSRKHLEQFLKESQFPKKESNYEVLLLHTPQHLLEDPYYERISQFDLVLSGHTHNGLMPEWARGNSGIISPGKRFFPKMVRGKMVRGSTTLIVSSGVMKLSYHSHFFRYFNFLFAMGITVIDLC